MSTIAAFTNALAAVTLSGVTTVYDDIPRELKASELPAQWVDMPAAVVSPDSTFSTFDESGVRHVATIAVAVADVSEGYPAAQRTAVLAMATTVEAWAITTPWQVEIFTAARIAVGSREYRGVLARVTAEEFV